MRRKKFLPFHFTLLHSSYAILAFLSAIRLGNEFDFYVIASVVIQGTSRESLTCISSSLGISLSSTFSKCPILENNHKQSQMIVR